MEGNTKEYVKFLRALANEERIAILEELEANGEITATQVEKHFYMEQSTASHHLNILKQAAIIQPRRSGRNIFYSLKEDRLDDFYQEFLTALRQKQAEKTNPRCRPSSTL